MRCWDFRTSKRATSPSRTGKFNLYRHKRLTRDSLPKDVWNACADVTEGRAVYGVSATSYGSSAFLAFQEAAPSGRSHNAIFLTEFKDGAWHAQESIGEQFSADPPQLAVLNGRINCVFNGAGEGRGGELRWFSRALLDFELGSWMRDLADDRLLSDITVPGTHDSERIQHV